MDALLCVVLYRSSSCQRRALVSRISLHMAANGWQIVTSVTLIASLHLRRVIMMTFCLPSSAYISTSRLRPSHSSLLLSFVPELSLIFFLLPTAVLAAERFPATPHDNVQESRFRQNFRWVFPSIILPFFRGCFFQSFVFPKSFDSLHSFF